MATRVLFRSSAPSRIPLLGKRVPPLLVEPHSEHEIGPEYHDFYHYNCLRTKGLFRELKRFEEIRKPAEAPALPPAPVVAPAPAVKEVKATPPATDSAKRSRRRKAVDSTPDEG